MAELSGAWYDDQTHQLLTVIDRRDESTLITMDLALTPAVSLSPARAVRVERALAQRTMDLEGVARAAACGVDCVSVGALTHSAPTLDLGLDLD